MSRKLLLIWLIVSTLLYVLSLIPWFYILIFSPMAFDAGYTMAAMVFIYLLLAYPVFLIVCVVLAWIFYKFSKDIAAWIMASLPLIVILASMVYVVI
jgi:hypothetical protein